MVDLVDCVVQVAMILILVVGVHFKIFVEYSVVEDRRDGTASIELLCSLNGH
jgi:hypothetical protein